MLMEQAAAAVVREVQKKAEKKDRIWAVCGTGNNGADGIAAARLLHLKGYTVTVILAGTKENGTDEYRKQLAIAERLGVNLIEYSDFIPGRCELVIDAVFGVGLSREVSGVYRDLLATLSGCGASWVVAVDIPSGIHADTGEIMGTALKADVTVTFGYEKLGTLPYPGRAWLSAMAAYRMGAGLVKIFTVEENRAVLQTSLPEAIITTYDPEEAQASTVRFQTLLEAQCEWASVIVLGPGIGQEPYTRNLVETVLANAYVPIILDADGLNTIAAFPELTNYFTENIIVTPHLGEMARLTGSPVEDIRRRLIPAAREYADRYGITCVLKDAVTVAALKDQRTYINTSGNSSMAKAGAGDVLTGIIAGLLALGMEESDAAAMGVYLHGRAGDLVRLQSGEHGLLARELTEALADILKETE